MGSTDIATHPFVVCSVLDPLLKCLTKFPDDIRQAAYGHVRELVLSAASHLVVAPPSTSQDSIEPPGKRSKVSDKFVFIKINK